MTIAAASRRRHRIWIFAAAAAVALLGAGIATLVMVNRDDPATRPVRDATREFLDRVKAGETDLAWATLCSSDRRQYSSSQFAQRIDRVIYFEVGDAQLGTDGDSTASVTVEIRYPGNVVESETIRLVYENRRWRPCHRPL